MQAKFIPSFISESYTFLLIFFKFKSQVTTVDYHCENVKERESFVIYPQM